jgi:two-component system response regulator GlrR
MEETRVLLLELGPVAGLANTLRGMLETGAGRPIQTLHESIDLAGGTDSISALGEITGEFWPNVVFVVLSLTTIKQAGTVLESLKRNPCNAPIIAVIEGERPEELVDLFRLGITDFVTPPLRSTDVLPRLWRLLDRNGSSETLTRALKEKLVMKHLRHLVGKCPTFVAEIEKVAIVAPCDASVLISGETGTGKELFARAIHYLSKRASKPFVPFSCGAVPVELVENELFGHTQGAFTSANSSRTGLIRECEGGTLFLDEVDCLPLAAQAKLSRFLQEKEYRQLGSAKIQYAEVRVIAATNVDLEKAVREGRFRQDLYYRLRVIPLILPPLRGRRADIPLLARHFLNKYSAEAGKSIIDLSPAAMEKLQRYDWPGNVRELKHVIERAVVFSDNQVIQDVDIELQFSENSQKILSFSAVKSRFIAKFEKNYIEDLLQSHAGCISKAARAAGKNRRAFWELIRKHKIDVRQFRPNGHQSLG